MRMLALLMTLALAGAWAGATLAQTAAPEGSEGAATSAGLYDGSPGASVETVFQAAQARRGPLDGRWRLSDAMGEPLYDFLLSDRGEAAPDPMAPPDQPPIEGAWRDLRSPGAIGDAGALDSVRRDGARLRIRFQVPGQAAPSVLVLNPLPSGVWIGETAIGGALKVVFLDRL